MTAFLLRCPAGLLLALLLAACSGVPLSSIPRLAALQAELLDGDPAEFALAVQVDERMVPPPGAAPTLNIELRPLEAGAFEPWLRKLPMRVTHLAPKVLPEAGRGRRWLVYRLTPDAQAEFLRSRVRLAQVRAERQGKSGGSLAIGMAQEGLAADDPRLAHTHWESWLQTSARGGFFKLWSGTLDDLKKQARAPGR